MFTCFNAALEKSVFSGIDFRVVIVFIYAQQYLNRFYSMKLLRGGKASYSVRS